MSISLKTMLVAFAGILSVGILSPVSTALAQALKPARRRSWISS
jgi:hypothetical protein